LIEGDDNVKNSFGSVKLFGHKYDEDVVVHVDGGVKKRKKKKSRDLKPLYGGHTPLSEKELDFLAEEKPKVVYVGIGYDSALPITNGAKIILDEYDAIVLPTPEVVDKIEHEKKKFVAIIHVTC
jgi:hypothetical protein